MIDFEFAAAHSVDEAVSLLAARGDRARILAGGTDILVQLREGQRDADLVLDIKRIPELTKLERRKDGSLALGAAVTCTRLYGDPQLARPFAALIDSAHIIGGWQIQSRATIGGNLCNASPAADSIPALIVLDATAHIAGPQGTRKIQVAEFCTGPGKNVLGRGEFLVRLDLPSPAPHSGSAYLRFIPRNEMDIAVVGAGAWVTLDSAHKTVTAARIALGAVAPTPVVAADASAWLVGKPANDASFAEAGARARAVAKPISDRRGTADYRTHLVGVLVQRALAIAAARARGESPTIHA